MSPFKPKHHHYFS